MLPPSSVVNQRHIIYPPEVAESGATIAVDFSRPSLPFPLPKNMHIATTSSHSYLITIGKNRVTQITLIFPAVIEQLHSVGQAEPDQISIFRLTAEGGRPSVPRKSLEWPPPPLPSPPFRPPLLHELQHRGFRPPVRLSG